MCRHDVFRMRLVLVILPVCACRFLLAASPYPASAVITNVSFEGSTHVRLASGSDNWAITWSDDDAQYAAWGDGWGFESTLAGGAKISLGVSRIDGAWDYYTGTDLWGLPVSGTAGGKSYGIVSIDGVLYMWVGPGSGGTSYTEARLYKSTDHASNWTTSDWAFVQADGIVMPTICNFGKDYAGARDAYVYHYFIHQVESGLAVHKPGKIYLARAPKTELMSGRPSYEWVSAFDAGHNPSWSTNLAEKVPVFEDPDGVGWCMSVSYNAGIGRYLLCTEHNTSFEGRLGIFDAPEPWGPWTTVGYYTDWEGFGSTFFWNFANKWVSTDGLDFTIVFTGTGANDSWNTLRGRFSTRAADIAPAAPDGLQVR